MKKIKGYKCALWIVMLVLSTNISFSQQYLDSIFLEKAEKEILELMKKGDIPGLSVTIISGDQEIAIGYGYQNLKDKKPVTPNTLFELGSCSKAFTALAIVNLANQDKLKLDDNVSDYIPWFSVIYNSQEAKVTIRQLLHHTSGIPWNTISKIPQTSADNALQLTIQQLVGQELNNYPGKKFEYATINYDVLALIIEKITKQSFETYVQHNVIDKLQLTQTSIGIPKDGALMSTGYKIGFFRPLKFRAPEFRGNYAAGYVISNAKDIARWLKFQMGMRIIDTATYELAELTHQRDKTVPLHGMSSYGMGWEISLAGTQEIYHTGLNPNFTSYIAFRADKKIAVAVLANSNSSYTAVIGNKIMRLVANEEPGKEFDPGDNNDKTYSILSIIISIYILVVLSLLIRIAVLAIKGKRKYTGFGWSTLIKFLRSLIVIVPFLYGFYILPQALAGFTWKSILIWTPFSFEALIYLMIGAVTLSYFSYLMSLFFQEENKYKRVAPQILLLSVLSGLSNVIVIIMVTSAIDSNAELKYLVFYYTLVVSVYLLGRRFVQINLIRFTRGLVYDLRIQLIQKIFSTSYQKFEKIDRGRIYTALNDDINTIGESTTIFVSLATSIITTIGAFCYLASIAFWATLLTIFLILALSVIYSLVAQRTTRYFEEARDERNVFMRLINGMIDGFKEICLHRNKKLEYKNDVATSADQYRVKLSTADIKFVNAFLVGESLLVILLGMVSFGMSKLFPDIQSYTVMGFVIVLLYLIGPINVLLSSMPSVIQVKVAWNRIRQFLEDIPANLDSKSIPEVIVSDVKSLKVRGIKFQYTNKHDEDIFGVGPIDLEIQKGEIIFIIGGNGSGKTTLAKLLTGLYEPNEGQIMINNKVVSGLELSEHFSTVFSPSYLFEKLYNINLEGKEEKVANYLKLLDLEEKVEIRENKYSTLNLSGGQRKRLALLQCYLEDSPIYLFDEWAADQDPEYRNFFYRTLLPEMKKSGKIVIAITHDDHYFDAADRVMKMRQGKLEVYLNEFAFTNEN